ncbi:MAG: hypothetical protein ACLGIR_04125 [Actinomycetes bacterium]
MTSTPRPAPAARRVGLGASRRRAAALLGALLVAATVAGALAAGALPSGRDTVRAAGTDAVTSAPDGCVLPDAATVPPEDRVASRIPPEDAPTAVDRTTAGVDVPGVLGDLRGFTRRTRTVGSWVLPSSGIWVEVLSDGDVDVDPMALDALLVATLTPVEGMRDARAVALLGCLHELVVERGTLGGSRLRLFVAADPRTCFRAGRLVDVDDGCDALGVALPPVDVRLRAFGRSIGGLAAPATIVVTAGTTGDGDDAAHRLASVLVHELYHHAENVGGLLPWRGPLVAYEQRATYVQRAVVEAAEDTGGLPVPLRLPAG